PASRRIRSRNALRAAVSPPPCAYLMTVVYRDDHYLSAPHDITHYKSVAWLLQITDRRVPM
ncbi:hypothetical protein, partial [Actinacidiphila glaucinigra]|uniref:hypothetical protein n=1 Tax=Actinacidiphila glaucinigra TaxID=235986 RepID=UPI0035D892CC